MMWSIQLELLELLVNQLILNLYKCYYLFVLMKSNKSSTKWCYSFSIYQYLSKEYPSYSYNVYYIQMKPFTTSYSHIIYCCI